MREDFKLIFGNRSEFIFSILMGFILTFAVVGDRIISPFNSRSVMELITLFVIALILFTLVSMIIQLSLYYGKQKKISVMVVSFILVGISVKSLISNKDYFLKGLNKFQSLLPASINVYMLIILLLLVGLLSLVGLIVLFKRYFLRWLNDTKRSISSIKFFCVIVAIFLLGSFLYLIAFNPVISSTDTVSQFMQAESIKPLVNWHTPAHTLSIRFLLSIFNHPTTIVASQIVLYCFVMWKMFYLLLQMGINYKKIIVIAILMAFLPTNPVHVITIWKDIPYALFLLWASVLIAEKLVNLRKSDWMFLLEYVFVITSIYLVRLNGVIPFLLSVIALLMIIDLKKAFLGIVVSVIGIVIITGPLFSFYEVQAPDFNGGQYIGLGQDIVFVKEYGGTLSETGEEIYSVLRAGKDDEFNPFRANLNYNLDMGYSKFLLTYIDTFFHNPRLMISAVLHRQELLWSIDDSEGAFVNLKFYTSEAKEDYWVENQPKRVTNVLTYLMTIIGGLSLFAPLNIFLWRVAIYIICSIYLARLVIKNGKTKWLIVMFPIIGQIFSLLVSTAWSDFRYYWPIQLCLVFFCLLAYASKKSNSREF